MMALLQVPNPVFYYILSLLWHLSYSDDSKHISDGYQHVQKGSDRCESIVVDHCLEMPYNLTYFPNLFGHQTQQEVLTDIANFGPLINIRCSSQLHFFLCAMYVPICTGFDGPLPPCSFVCQAARTGCANIMLKFGFAWPAAFDCEDETKFPIMGKDLCVYMNKTQQENAASAKQPVAGDGQSNIYIPGIPDGDFGRISQDSKRYQCPLKLHSRSPSYKIRIGNETVAHCGLACSGVLFPPEDDAILRSWVGGWAICCLVVTGFTLLTFLIDPQRFEYPARPIIFYALCYFVIALVYVAGFALDYRAVCDESEFSPTNQWSSSDPIGSLRAAAAASDQSVAAFINDNWKMLPATQQPLVSTTAKLPAPKQALLLINQGTEHELCTLLAVLQYFFLLAAHLSWVVLTCAWFLAAVMKWSQEAISDAAQYFHLVWILPAVLTIVVLARGTIDGDIHSGLCSVGNWDADVLLVFVVWPLAACWLVSLVLFLVGFVSLFQIRRYMKHVPPSCREAPAHHTTLVPPPCQFPGARPPRSEVVGKTTSVDGVSKLDKLMFKVSLVSVFYNVSTILLISCYLYQAWNVPSWILTWFSGLCRSPEAMKAVRFVGLCPSQDTGAYNSVVPGVAARAEFVVFMIKYFMLFWAGISCLLWICSPKTVASWTAVSRRLCHRRFTAVPTTAHEFPLAPSSLQTDRH